MITEQSTLQNFVARTQLMFALPLPQLLTIMLKYCEHAIFKDFKISPKIIQLGQKFRKLCAKQFAHAFEKLAKQERISFYYQISGYILKMTNRSQDLPVLKFQNIQTQGYIRHNTFKTWNKVQLVYDRINHMLQIKKVRNQDKTRIDLSLYMVRNSKNINYHAFVLEACDKRADGVLRSLTFGFEVKKDYQSFMGCVKQSVNFRWWQKIQSMFKGDVIARNSINSIKNQSLYQRNSNTQQTYPQQQFYSFQDLSFQNYQDQDQQEKYQKQLSQKSNNNKIFTKASHSIMLWNIEQKLQYLSDCLKWQPLIECEQFTLKKYKNKKLETKNTNILLIKIPASSDNTIKYYFNKFKQMASKQIQMIKNLNIDKTCVQRCKNIGSNCPIIFYTKRQQVKIAQNEIIVHQFSFQPQNFKPSYKIEENVGHYQALWKFQSISKQVQFINLMIQLTTDQHETPQKQLKFSIKYLRGVFQRFLQITKVSTDHLQFFDRNTIKLDDKTELIEFPLIGNYQKYKMQPWVKGVQQQATNYIVNQGLITQQWKIDEKGCLQFINQQKMAAQKGVIKSIISQLGRNLLSGKSILNVSLPVQIFSCQSHLDRMLHSMRLAPVLFQQISLIQKQNISQNKLKQILKISAVFGITTSILYLNQQKSFNPILGQTCQMWIDGCPAYAEQISHHPPISSVYFIGRGYKIYGQLEAKVQLGLNSGKGSNDGELVIQLDNGMKVTNYFPSGEVSGLSYGKRKFTIVGKSHHFIEQAGLYLQVDYSCKNQQVAGDNFSSKLYKIDKNEIIEFRKKRKFKNPKNHFCISHQNPHFLHGSWSRLIKSEQKVLLDIQKTKIPAMHRQWNLLLSDSIYREDILYRYKQDYTRAQKYKTLLEENQRRDKKLRNKFK